MSVSSAANLQRVSINVLVIALWFGMVAGLLEGVGSLILLSLGRLDGVWVEILWVSPLFDALLFGLLGVALILAYLVFRRLPVTTMAVFLFSALTLFIWLELALPWEIHSGALLILSLGVGSVVTRWFHQHRAVSIRFWERTLPVMVAITIMAGVAVQGGFWILEATS